VSETNSIPKEKTLEGRYANYFKVGHNAFEFIFDFGQYYPENGDVELFNRVVISPAYVETFANLLNDSIRKFKATYVSSNNDEW
jgi:hypothetical protein